MSLRVCTRCVMDTTDAGITFDVDGVCDNCRRFERDVVPHWHTGERGEKLFAAANEPKQFMTIPNNRHNDPLPNEFFTKLKSFLDQNPVESNEPALAR